MKKAMLLICLLSVFALLTVILMGCFIAGGDDSESSETTLSAPTNIRANAVSPTSISVTWNAVKGAKDYDVFYETNSSPLVRINTVTGTSYIHMGLQANTTYHYYVRTKDSKGNSSDYSTRASATTPALDGSTTNEPGVGSVLAAPTNVTAIVQSSSSIRISWNSVKNATGYDVYYGIYSSSPDFFASSVTSSPYIHNGLQPDMSYYSCYAKMRNKV